MLFSVFRPFLFRVQKKKHLFSDFVFFREFECAARRLLHLQLLSEKKNIGKWQISKVHVSFAYSKVVRVS
jgi:hypothetical protein